MLGNLCSTYSLSRSTWSRISGFGLFWFAASNPLVYPACYFCPHSHAPFLSVVLSTLGMIILKDFFGLPASTYTVPAAAYGGGGVVLWVKDPVVGPQVVVAEEFYEVGAGVIN